MPPQESRMSRLASNTDTSRLTFARFAISQVLGAVQNNQLHQLSECDVEDVNSPEYILQTSSLLHLGVISVM